MHALEIKQILAAIDFSDWTQPVLQAAAEMAQRYGAKLTVAYAEMFLPPPYFTARGMEQISDFLEKRRQGDRQRLDEIVERELGEGISADVRLVEASPTEGILRTAELVEADLIVMGTHGHSGLSRLLLGSVAEKVLRSSAVPVLTVRGSEGETARCRLPFQKILCPSNYTPVAREALAYAVDVARRSQAELLVMTSLEEEGNDEEVQAQQEKLCADVSENMQAYCTVRPVVRHGHAAEQILKTAAEEQCDLIVIGAQDQPLLETFTIGTTSVRVVRHATCPVLTVNRRSAPGE